MFPCAAKNNERFLLLYRKFESSTFLCIRIDDRVMYVWTVAVAAYNVCLSIKQYFCNASEDLRRGCRSECSYNGNFELLNNFAECKIGRPKTVTPFAYTMCFIDCNVCDVTGGKSCNALLVLQYLRICQNDFCAFCDDTKVFFTLLSSLLSAKDNACHSSVIHSPLLIGHKCK